MAKVNKRKIVETMVFENRRRCAEQFNEWRAEGKRGAFSAGMQLLGMRYDVMHSRADTRSAAPSSVPGAKGFPVDELAEEFLMVDVSTRNKWLRIITEQRFEMLQMSPEPEPEPEVDSFTPHSSAPSPPRDALEPGEVTPPPLPGRPAYAQLLSP